MKSRNLPESFKYAGQGVKTAFTGERNFKIHCITAIIVIIFGVVFHLSALKWALLCFAIGLVLVCELVNTAGETLVDMVTREYSREAKRVKDILAAAVLFSAVTAVLAGIFVFAEPVLDWIARIIAG